MKKILSAAAIAVVAAGAFTLASCNNGGNNNTTTVEETEATKILRNYIFENEDKTVSEDFEVPASLTFKGVDYKLEWTSSSENLVVGTEDEKTGLITIQVVRPATERVSASLTVKLIYSESESAEATYGINVAPIDVYEIVDNFAFAQDGTTLYSDFTLPTKATYAGVSADVTWEVVAEEGKTSPIALDGTTAKVTPCETRTKTTLKATFSYNGSTTSKTYTITVYHERTALELLHAFYDEATVYDEAFTLKGYVAAKAGYSASYGDGYLYIMDQTKQGGYYIYYGYCSQEVWDSLEVGTRVQITSCTATKYNGLIETTSSKDKKVTVITDDSVLAPLTADELAAFKKGVAIDDMVLSDSKDLVYQTGNRVSLTGWKVTAVNTDVTATKSGTALTLEKDGKTMTLQTSKYGVDLKTDATTPTTSDKIVAAWKDIKVGDYVNVTGVLSCYKSFYILAVDESCVTLNADYAADIAALNSAMDAISINTAYIASTTVALNIPEGITANVSITGSAVTYADGTLTITLLETGETDTITITLTKGSTSISKTFTTDVRYRNAQEQVQYEADNLTVTATVPGKYTLPTAGTTYSDVAITYEFEGLSYSNGTLTIGAVDAETTYTGKAILSKEGAENVEKAITLTISNPTVTVYDTPKADTEYKVYISQNDELYYLTGSMVNTYYLATGTTEKNGLSLKVEADGEDGYQIYYMKDGTTKTYLIATVSGTHYNVSYSTTKSTYKWNFEDGYAYVTLGDVKCMLGSNGTNTTGSLNTNFTTACPLIFDEKTEKTYTRQEKVDYEKSKLTLSDGYSNTSVNLPSMKVFNDVTVTYTATGDNASLVTVKDGKLVFGTVTTATTVPVTATLECNGVKATKEFTLTITPFSSVTTISEAADNSSVAGTGIIYATHTSGDTIDGLLITDGTTSFEIYKVLKDVDGKTISFADTQVGKVVRFTAIKTTYGGVVETTSTGAVVYDLTDASADWKVLADQYLLSIDSTKETQTLVKEGAQYKSAITYSIAKDTSGKIHLSDDGYTLTIDKVGANTPVIITATLTLDGVTKDYDINLTLTPTFETIATTIASTPEVGKTYYIQGTVTSVNSSSNYAIVSDGTNEIKITGDLTDETSVKYADLKKGNIVCFYGTYAEEGTTKKITSASIAKQEAATNAEKVAWTLNEIADTATYNDETYCLAKTGTLYTDTTITWSLKSGTAATVDTENSKITGSQLDADDTVVITAEVSCGTDTAKVTQTKDVTVTITKYSATKTRTLAYNVAKTTNMDGTDQAELLGLDTNIFNVVGTKASGSNTNVGLNQALDIRLYKSAAQSLDISVVDGYTIDSIVINVKSGSASNLKVYSGDTIYTKSDDGSYVINGSSVSITDTGSATVQISSIEITYSKTPE